MTLLLAAGAAQAQGKPELQWFAQSAFKLTTPGGKVIMIDPWITGNPKTPAELKDLDKLGKVDLILVTHAHGDHLGDAVEIAKKNNVPIWGPAGMNQMLTDAGRAAGQPAAAHEQVRHHRALPRRQDHPGPCRAFLGDDPEGSRHRQGYELPAGEPVGLIIQLENGFKIYHMGDTGVFGDMKLIGDYYKPDLLLIPIGGHFVMDPKDAAFATKLVKPKMAFPMHYGTNPFLKGTPAEYKAAMGQTPIEIVDMNPGDKKTF